MDASDFMDALVQLSAYGAMGATLTVGYGFVRLALRHTGIIGDLATGLLLMHAAVLLRTLYWDGLRAALPDPVWQRWYEMSGETAINLLFNTMIVLAGYHSLRALRLSIPEEIRGEYTLLGAAFYPRIRLLEALKAALIRFWRRFFG